MSSSTMNHKNKNSKNKIKMWSVAFWLVLWQLLSDYIGQEILLVSPVAVIFKLLELVRQNTFWSSIAFSFIRIIGGFFLAMFSGILIALLSYQYLWVKHLMEPLVLVIKSIPVASFIILSLIWISSKNISVFISFLICFPVKLPLSVPDYFHQTSLSQKTFLRLRYR